MKGNLYTKFYDLLTRIVNNSFTKEDLLLESFSLSYNLIIK